MRRTYRPGEQQPSYSIGRWFDSLIQHRVFDRSQLLQTRVGGCSYGAGAVAGGDGGCGVRVEQDDEYEGESE